MARLRHRPGFFARLPLPSRTEARVLAVVLLVTVVAVGLAAWRASTRTPPPYTPRQDSSTSTAPPSASTTSSPPTSTAPTLHQAVLAFYGDWFVSGTAQGGVGPTGWPALVSRRLGARGTTPHAVPDAGYLTPSQTTGASFLSLAQTSPETAADVTVGFGGRNDYRAVPAELTAAAQHTFETIRSNAPTTRLLVIGPAWPQAQIPAELIAVRDAVRQAATASGATFVDPLAAGWFVSNPELIGGDGISPTDSGHVYLADRIEPLVRQLLTPATASAGQPRSVR